MLKENLILIGFMGTGKSAVAACLGQLLDRPVDELDALIAQREGQPIPEIFRLRGEGYFRDLEREMLQGLQGCGGRVVSCGGGIVTREENIALIKRAGRVILLTAEAETVYRRVKDDGERPVLQGRMNPQAIAALMEGRREHYRRAADLTVATDGKTVVEICREILKLLGE